MVMRFSQSLSVFKYLSELYQADAPHAVLMTEYPSSNSPDTRFRNTHKYIIHDPFPPPPIGLLKTLGPHHLMYGWGKNIPVTSEVQPPAALIEHWRKTFGGDGCPDWQALQDDKAYITSFPFETLPTNQQVVEPETLYHLHSKEALAEIACPQADIYQAVQFPCILKLSHGYAGLGNFIVRNAADLEKAQAQLTAQWPDAPVIINQLLTDIIGDYGVQFYLNKQGEITTLGFTQQVFNATGRWTGGIFDADIQDAYAEDFAKIVKPVAEYLHKHGYFGVVGVDILQNAENEFFLVDLNPRLTGITPFLIASRLFLADGYKHGIYAASMEFSGSLEEVLERVEAIADARVLILSAYKAPGAETIKCHVSISGTTRAACGIAFADLTV